MIKRVLWFSVSFILFLTGCNRKDFLNPNDPINFPSAPAIGYPQGDTLIYDNPPTFYWGMIDTSVFTFELQVADNENFSNPLVSIRATGYDTIYWYTPNQLFPEHCFWRVRAKREGASDKAWGEWSSIGSFWERFPLVAEDDELPGGDNIIIRGDYAYIINSNIFHILDVHNPIQPVLISSFTDSAVHYFRSIEKEGEYLYLGCYKGYLPYYSLRIYSISNPSSPQFVGACSLNYSPTHLAISYPAVFVAHPPYYYVKIVDVSDPSNPFVADSISESPRYGLAVKGNYLILFTPQIKIYDITDPFSPSLANSYDSYYPEAFCISGDTMFVYEDYPSPSITIFDISSLPSINKLSSFILPNYIYISKMCYSSNCLATPYYIYELNGTQEPKVGRLPPSKSVSSIAANKGYLYLISKYEEGMQVVKLCK